MAVVVEHERPGELRYVEELGGGALMDLGCYCLHWIRTIAGDEPTVVSVSARCATPGVDVEVEAELAFTSGPTATLKCSMQPEDGVLLRRLRVRGDKGLLDFENPVSPHAGATLAVESTYRRRHRSSPAVKPRFISSCGT